MFTETQWFNNPELALRLGEFLKDPVVEKALQVLIHSKLPAPVNLPDTDFLAHNAVINARREGYYMFYRDLLSLTVEPKPSVDLSKPWKGKHINPVE
jgi:hypothetical protein